jgi:hypothetical protein
MGWMNYREGHWQPDNENLAIQETAKEFVTRIHSYFEGCGTIDEIKAAKGAKSRARIKAMHCRVIDGPAITHPTTSHH